MSKFWNDERLARAEKLWRSGVSATTLAAMFTGDYGEEVTRNAIIGQAHRRGWVAGRTRANMIEAALSETRTRRGRGVRPLPEPAPRPPQVAKIAPAGAPQPLAAMFRAPAAPARPELPGVGILQLTADTCRWPLWGHERPRSVEDYRFCGEPPCAGGPYCPHHAAGATTGATSPRRFPIWQK